MGGSLAWEQAKIGWIERREDVSMSPRRPRVPHAHSAQQARKSEEALRRAQQREHELEQQRAQQREQELQQEREQQLRQDRERERQRAEGQPQGSASPTKDTFSATAKGGEKGQPRVEAQAGNSASQRRLAKKQRRLEKTERRRAQREHAQKLAEARAQDTEERKARFHARQQQARQDPSQQGQSQQSQAKQGRAKQERESLAEPPTKPGRGLRAAAIRRRKARINDRLTERAALQGAIRSTGKRTPAEKNKPAPQQPVPAKSLSMRVIVLTIVIAISVVTVFPALTTLGQQTAELNKARADIAKAKAEQERLTRELKRWDDPEYIRQQSRNRLNVYAPGEKLYVPVGKPAKKKLASTNHPSGYRQGLPWVEGLWDSTVSLAVNPTTRFQDSEKNAQEPEGEKD